jgi:hypothetical protein
MAAASIGDPAGSGVIVSAVRWLEGTLLGTIATVVAVIAVASVGLMMLTGRINWRYGATVIFGCFILFGAAHRRRHPADRQPRQLTDERAGARSALLRLDAPPNVRRRDLLLFRRMRPDRILLGELRGDEAYAFLRAVNSGHPGSMTTVHADSAERAIEQIVLLALQAGTQLGRNDVRHYVRTTVDVFVQVTREAGRRRVAEVVLSR